MPLKSYKICSKIFKHGNDPPPFLTMFKETADLVKEGTPYQHSEIWISCLVWFFFFVHILFLSFPIFSSFLRIRPHGLSPQSFCPGEPNWTNEDHMDPGGTGWTKVDPSGLRWTLVDSGGPRWTQVDTGGPVWTRVDQCGSVWTRVDPSGPT